MDGTSTRVWVLRAVCAVALIGGALVGPVSGGAGAQAGSPGEERCIEASWNTWVAYEALPTGGFWFDDHDRSCFWDEPFLAPTAGDMTCFNDTPGTIFRYELTRDGFGFFNGYVEDEVCQDSLEATQSAVSNAVVSESVATVDELFALPELHSGHSIVLRLYWAVLDRKPELDGAEFWLHAYDSGGWDIRRIAAHFVVSEEFQGRYGELSNADFTTQIYRNVLDRDPDTGGFDFWFGRLEAGMSRSEMVLLISNDGEFIGNHPLPSDVRPNTGPNKPSIWDD